MSDYSSVSTGFRSEYLLDIRTVPYITVINPNTSYTLICYLVDNVGRSIAVIPEWAGDNRTTVSNGVLYYRYDPVVEDELVTTLLKLRGAVVGAKYVVNGVEVAASKRFDVNL